jgi:hypothetical protein
MILSPAVADADGLHLDQDLVGPRRVDLDLLDADRLVPLAADDGLALDSHLATLLSGILLFSTATGGFSGPVGTKV